MHVTRARWIAWLLAAALALLPLHAAVANIVAAAVAADASGDCHGSQKAPDAPDTGMAGCGYCGACHAVDAQPLLIVAAPGAVAAPPVTMPPRLYGRVLQPDLHPPLA